jgi:hypothetical protein
MPPLVRGMKQTKQKPHRGEILPQQTRDSLLPHPKGDRYGLYWLLTVRRDLPTAVRFLDNAQRSNQRG